MKFNFKTQDYQTKAVESVIKVFKGQGKSSKLKYRLDPGQEIPKHNSQMEVGIEDSKFYSEDFIYTAFKNRELEIDKIQLLSNIKSVQINNGIKTSEELVKGQGACSLDIEMETGTGKTYVYIKTMFELNKNYGWSKFIVIVPSIAIREGVKKSFEMTEDHFMELYGKKIRYFIYDSKNLNQIDAYSSDGGINVMIINTQAFNTLKEGAKNKAARIIYSKRDEFGSRKPIDVIKSNNPILIIDEPQKMGGTATQEAMKNFNPLFSLNYSATHKNKHNLVYALDAVDAFNERLVKKIEVKGFELKNFRGSDRYLYLDDIILSKNEAPKARIEFEINYKKSINRESRILSVDDNLYDISKGMDQYKGYRVAEIEPREGLVRFTNGEELRKGEVRGDVSEKDMRLVQIRETIKSHFEKEEELFNKGIKTLSLFFIDEVAKYRQYDEDGNELLGEYGKIFEREYINILNEYITFDDTPYIRYLKSIDVKDTHKGYFSIDKKGRLIDSKEKGTDKTSDDISAYDLILKNKERLLSFKEPTRFIFSHSALREGWDNPNVFQICTLKHGNSATMKRQEVGRGLRLCVDKNGFRMDEQTLGRDGVHKLNKLTVIASESYKDFVRDLQRETKENLHDRPLKASKEYFVGKTIFINGEKHTISQIEANICYQYLVKNDYVTMDGEDKITDKYHEDSDNNTLAPLPDTIKEYGDEIHRLIRAVFSDKVLEDMQDDGHQIKILENKTNDNFKKKEFKSLWESINQKYSYTVSFDSDELIKKSVESINDNLFVYRLRYTTGISEQKDNFTVADAQSGMLFKSEQTKTYELDVHSTSDVEYDLIGRISSNTMLTRRTVVKILKGLNSGKFYMFRENPEEFISKVSRLINEQKATTIVEHISYDKIDEKYDKSIFTLEKSGPYNKAYEAKKHIKDYVFTDGDPNNSVEGKFAKDLDGAEEVCVYAKLPRGFYIPTPVGNYSPDWAIAFNAGTVKHIFFIAETKGTMESLQLRPIEQAKIYCAKKLFNEISTDDVVYHEVDSYENLLNIMTKI
ncbi:type III restriction-modification system endonuclease [Neofamilia massiliensis]|uniref:type III restriction-modification system endonuclease n=1 Tax=Neofamilia massiliensis TaxID=1673724 RepID=UPI0006BB6C3B|nr:DEAD/DEAH box helicase family protein [Neofamilia massiliensis]